MFFNSKIFDQVIYSAKIKSEMVKYFFTGILRKNWCETRRGTLTYTVHCLF